ncbi:hypothetical protein AAMO2058_000903100 [Amorphochlora amoebiformis]
MGQEASVDAQQKQSKGIPARPPGNPPPSSKDLIFLSQPKNQNVSNSRTSAMTEDSVFRESQLIDVKFMEGNNRNSPTEKVTESSASMENTLLPTQKKPINTTEAGSDHTVQGKTKAGSLPLPAKPIQGSSSTPAFARLEPSYSSCVPGGKLGKDLFSKGKFKEKWEVGEELGSGATSVVYVCVNKETKREAAVKVIFREHATIDEKKFAEEIGVLRKIRHKNIIRLYDIFQTEKEILIVTELACGGELFDRLLDVKHFSEGECVILCHRLMSAVAYLHQRGICHRDLKPENVMFMTNEKNDLECKLVDFGFAKSTFNRRALLRAESKLGTKGYAAPEIFSGKQYTEKCDIWSLGVISYILLCGYPPFVVDVDFNKMDDNELENTPFWVWVNQMYQHLSDEDSKEVDEFPQPTLEFPKKQWSCISGSGKDFVKRLLRIEPRQRPRAMDALKHEWIMHENSSVGRKHKSAKLTPHLRRSSSSDNFLLDSHFGVRLERSITMRADECINSPIQSPLESPYQEPKESTST